MCGASTVFALTYNFTTPENPTANECHRVLQALCEREV
jgi:hypothetical protein